MENRPTPTPNPYLSMLSIYKAKYAKKLEPQLEPKLEPKLNSIKKRTFSEAFL